jgi:hypothetical protein
MYYSILQPKVNDQTVNIISASKTEITSPKEFFTKGYLQIWYSCAIIILNIVYQSKKQGCKLTYGKKTGLLK